MTRKHHNGSHGVFTSSRVVDAVLSRRDAQRFQFRTLNGFEYTTKTASEDERGENYWDIHNTGNKKTKYMDMPAMSAASLPDRSCTKYAFDYDKKPSLDQEATSFLASGLKDAYGTISYRRPPQVDWSMYKKSRYMMTYKDVDKDDRIFARPAVNATSDADTSRVLNGRGGSQVLCTHLQSTHNHLAVALPPGKKAAHPAHEPKSILEPPQSYSGKMYRSTYDLDSGKARDRLSNSITERKRLMARLTSSPLL
eukprot:TRINITY_DN92827_c0_g1_i1.p1 TRINITY_DN92827_c0_g1~~TRINITY_DN92827_c0_g1_i1.p1  ORF type:complete len:253 (-),score=47.43 TRINITY_DN92827_c0_g1_i1:117-875(-)